MNRNKNNNKGKYYEKKLNETKIKRNKNKVKEQRKISAFELNKRTSKRIMET